MIRVHRAALDRRRHFDVFTFASSDVPLNALDCLLGNAKAFNHLRRVEWLLAHGADPNSLQAYSRRPQLEEAQIHGYIEIAALL